MNIPEGFIYLGNNRYASKELYLEAMEKAKDILNQKYGTLSFIGESDSTTHVTNSSCEIVYQQNIPNYRYNRHLEYVYDPIRGFYNRPKSPKDLIQLFREFKGIEKYVFDYPTNTLTL